MNIGAIDIGGTTIKTAIATEHGELRTLLSYPTEAMSGGDHVVSTVLSICKDMQLKEDIQGIAISTAGQVDAEQGTILFATDNIPGYTGMEVKKIVSSALQLPVAVENDVNCTALGEQWQGAARGIDDFLTLALGTGIGGALFLNGELYRGATSSGGELGHMILYPKGKLCTCGQNGCYEQYASSAALVRKAEQQFGTLSLPDFFVKVRQGDAAAADVFEEWIDDLTTGLGSLIQVLNPAAVVIGGGISAQGRFLKEAIRPALDSKLMPNHKEGLQILLAEKGNDANLLGAVRHFLNRYPGGC